MIQGGIQGDEDAGFIAGQILTRTKVRAGRLIVVPRADVPSINIHKRQCNVDLNRRFDKDHDRFFEDRLARAIRFVIGKCDGFIHLHEGSGFYTPKYVDALHGPHRYGQSVIIDTDVYQSNLYLGEMATRVIDRVNRDMVPRKWGFNLFNTKTFSPSTPYPEQQKSLSFYAVKELNIPALAVEVSKDIRDLDWKVRQQIKVVQGLLREFGLVCTVPRIGTDEIKKWHHTPVLLRINDRLVDKHPVVLSPYIPFSVTLVHPAKDQGDDREYAVYAQGREGYNLVNSEYIPLSPFDTLQVVVDGKRVAGIPVQWKGTWSHKRKIDNPIWVYSLNDRIHYTPSGSVVEVYEGDQLILEGIWHGKQDEILNIKGYVSEKGRNTGQDAQSPLMVSTASFMHKYLDMDEGYWQFRAVRETAGTVDDYLRFRVLPRSVKAIELQDVGAGKTILPTCMERIQVRPGTYTVNDIWTQRGDDETMVMVDEWPVSNGQTMVWEEGESHSIGLYGSRDLKPLHTLRVRVSLPLHRERLTALQKRTNMEPGGTETTVQ